MTVKAEVEALAGEAAEELEQRGRVFGPRWAKAHRGPVAENDVGNSLHRPIKRWNPHWSSVVGAAIPGIRTPPQVDCGLPASLLWLDSF
jgi:hypothetical protein